jgi:hypothetical protein
MMTLLFEEKETLFGDVICAFGLRHGRCPPIRRGNQKLGLRCHCITNERVFLLAGFGSQELC